MEGVSGWLFKAFVVLSLFDTSRVYLRAAYCTSGDAFRKETWVFLNSMFFLVSQIFPGWKYTI